MACLEVGWCNQKNASLRGLRSEEARNQLHSAHSRILAVAELERRLCEVSGESVDLHHYLADLCANLSAAVIVDATRVKIAVAATPAMVSAATASSLGMIVAELVTNAQKYAFPDGRAGTIRVMFEPRGRGWLLRVADDGCGMSETPGKPGLGAGIVRALARHLGAAVTVEPATVGVTVCVAFAGAEPRAARRPFTVTMRRPPRGAR